VIFTNITNMVFKQVGFGAGNGLNIVRKMFGQVSFLIYALQLGRV